MVHQPIHDVGLVRVHHPGLARWRRGDFVLERPADRRVMQSKSPRHSFNLETLDENQPPNLGPELVSHHRYPDAAKPISCLALRSGGTSLRKLSLRRTVGTETHSTTTLGLSSMPTRRDQNSGRRRTSSLSASSTAQSGCPNHVTNASRRSLSASGLVGEGNLARSTVP